ncbi:MAG: succinyl-diaminopimelate desuccinylase [Pseudomonadota bacterium]
MPEHLVTTDPVELTTQLVRCPSVTPEEGGALGLLAGWLSSAGFDCTRVDRGGVANLFARWGPRGHPRTFGFNGHTDVVPVGDEAAWSHPPFGAEIADGKLFGRGATDMKSGVAAFAASAIDLVQTRPPTDGAIILLITGDEEGDATDGTQALLDWMESQDEAMSVCLVGEPTCPDVFGEMIKIGRRGSLTAKFTAHGKQGHSAYPHRARNPVETIVRLAERVQRQKLDEGTAHFDPSTLVITTIDTGNTATNVIPAACHMTLNIRFNDLHSGESLQDWLVGIADEIGRDSGVPIDSTVRVSGEAFLTLPGDLSKLVVTAVRRETGLEPKLSTTGGTSDARFVKNHCPVVEFGLVGKTMHAIDENVEVAQIHQLKAVYSGILQDYFANV